MTSRSARGSNRNWRTFINQEIYNPESLDNAHVASSWLSSFESWRLCEDSPRRRHKFYSKVSKTCHGIRYLSECDLPVDSSTITLEWENYPLRLPFRGYDVVSICIKIEVSIGVWVRQYKFGSMVISISNSKLRKSFGMSILPSARARSYLCCFMYITDWM